MPLSRRTSAAIAAALVVAGATHVFAQHPPDFYTLVDAGAISSPSCSCIASPFALPRYRPGQGYQGAAAPLDRTAPVSAADLQRYLDERRTIGRDAGEGRDGNGHASFSVALHVSLQPGDAGADPKTDEETVRWLQLAAQQEHADAFMFLGHRFRQGLGVEQSDQAAAYWFHRAAAVGHNVGMVALGLLHAAGRGVPQDWAAAVHWWQKAEATHPLAARLLGDAYVCGVGVPADPERAATIYKKSAEAGELTASVQLAHLYANGCAKGDDEQAVAAFKRAADEGLPDAQVAFSEFLRSGRGGVSQYYDAYYWARLAERRLPDGELRMRAAAAATDATRFLSADEIAAAEQMVNVMIAEGSKPAR